MMDVRVWKGVESLLDGYVKIRPDDFVVILYTSDSYESAAWLSAALDLREITVRRVWMVPIRDDGFFDRLKQALPAPTDLIGRLVVLSFERDTMSHTSAIAAALKKYDKQKCVTFRAISASPSLFADALRVVPEELSALNTALLERCMPANRLHITTRGGSDLEVAIDSKRHRWISNRGIARPGGINILPSGEVATYPASVAGVFVADFAFNVNAITDLDTRLRKHPVSVKIEEGRAVEYKCSDPTISQFLEDCFRKQCAYNVGELGFGTNVGVVDSIPMNSHINERRPGVHLGFGQHNQDPEVVDYQCSIHLDLVAEGGRVWVDDDPTPLDLEDLSPSSQAHPTSPRDEDVFSPEMDDRLDVDDCCGIITSEGLSPFSPPITTDSLRLFSPPK